MNVKLTYDRIALFCLILTCALVTVAFLSTAIATVATMKILDIRWQQYHESAMQEQADALDTEHRAALGEAEIRRIEDVWIMYYNTCLFTTGQMDNCLKSARNGYVNGAHDEKPLPGWDWHYVQFGEFLDNG